jgi:hypothetical protein
MHSKESVTQQGDPLSMFACDGHFASHPATNSRLSFLQPNSRGMPMLPEPTEN